MVGIVGFIAQFTVLAGNDGITDIGAGQRSYLLFQSVALNALQNGSALGTKLGFGADPAAHGVCPAALFVSSRTA